MNYTNHARLRMSQRNISEQMIENTIDYGEHVHARGADMFYRSNNKYRQKPNLDGRKTAGLMVIMGNNREIRTAYISNNPKWRA